MLIGGNSPLNVAGPGSLRRSFTEMVCNNELSEDADPVARKVSAAFLRFNDIASSLFVFCPHDVFRFVVPPCLSFSSSAYSVFGFIIVFLAHFVFLLSRTSL